jgi:hypothetical protein
MEGAEYYVGFLRLFGRVDRAKITFFLASIVAFGWMPLDSAINKAGVTSRVSISTK